jgi:lycopene cyclase domain-containing protein
VTYALILLPFAALTVVVTLLSARRPAFGRRMLASTVAAVALVILTAVFDNVMISAGLVVYPEGRASGLRIGVAPIEDFAYPVCGAFLLPAVWVLLPRRTPT